MFNTVGQVSYLPSAMAAMKAALLLSCGPPTASSWLDTPARTRASSLS